MDREFQNTQEFTRFVRDLWGFTLVCFEILIVVGQFHFKQ